VASGTGLHVAKLIVKLINDVALGGITRIPKVQEPVAVVFFPNYRGLISMEIILFRPSECPSNSRQPEKKRREPVT